MAFSANRPVQSFVADSLLCFVLRLFDLGLFISCLFSSFSFAQHPTNRVAAPTVVPRPPVYRAPIYQPPSYGSPGYTPHVLGVPSTNSFVGFVYRPPVRPVHPFPPGIRFYIFPVTTGPWWQSDLCWWATCDRLWTADLLDGGVSVVRWNPVNAIAGPVPENPPYVFGAEAPDIPELFLKDGTALYVNDYWVADDQLHFMIVEDEGMKPAEHIVPFDELDLQKTIDINTQRGFRFLLRNEPFEQYVRDHPEGPPPALSAQ